MKTRTIVPAVVTILVMAGPSSSRADWPNFLGPNYDGISSERAFKKSFDRSPPVLWEKELGSAFSAFACVADRVYTCGTKGGRQVLFCLNANTGKILWERDIEEAYRERQGGDGARATPTVSDGKVYVVGGRKNLLCVNAKNGKPVWQNKLSNPPTWGYSFSVLVEGNLAVIYPGGENGGMLALDKNTGKEVWRCGKGIAGYATPYPFTFAGKRYIVGFLGKSILIGDAQTGREIWSTPWKTSYDVNAASPIFHDGHLLVSSGYGHGCALFRVAEGGGGLKVTKVWEKKVLRNKFQSPVLYKGKLYSGDEKGLRCVDFKTGNETWSVPRQRHATVLIADGHLIVLTEKGELQMAKASPEKYEPFLNASYLEGRCWTMPTLHKGLLYLRDFEKTVCVDLRTETALNRE